MKQMELTRKFMCLLLVVGLSCTFVAGHNSGHNVKSAVNRFRNFRPKPLLNGQHPETFNRPEGTESFVPLSETQYGRTFGQYGSYKKHTSWQQAVANDRQKHIKLPEEFKTKFPWVVHQLHTPSIHGFGLNGFWNSYAMPEGTPNVKGLSPSKFD